MDRPNIILLTIDTLRWDRVGCYGRVPTITPNIDRLAASGIRFEQAITGGSWTQAAFPTILTSSFASMYGGCLGPLSPDRPSPVEALSNAGYATAAFTSHPLLSRTYGYDRGFHDFLDIVPSEEEPVLRRLKGGQRLLRNPLTHYVSGLFGKHMRPARLYEPAALVNEAVFQWLKDVQLPFFAWIHYMDVHWPYHLEEELRHPKDIAQAWKDLSHFNQVNWHGEKITAHQRERYIQLYEKAVQYTDTQIGLLLNHLESSGSLDNTAIVIVSDHGEEFLERSHWGHVESNLYDEIVKIPLIIRLPGGGEEQIVEHQVSTMDIMPTVMELCQCLPPANIEGRSLVPLWSGRENEYGGQVAISERWRNVGDVSHAIAVRTGAFKYIWNSNHPARAELYDLRVDPGETRNVVNQYPEIASKLQNCVDEHELRATPLVSDDAEIEPALDAQMIARLRGLGYVE